MISPTSTTVLDCIYQKKPAAIFNEGLSIFNELPVIDGIDDIESFLETVKSNSYNFEKMYSRFGDVEENLDKAAEIIDKIDDYLRTATSQPKQPVGEPKPPVGDLIDLGQLKKKSKKKKKKRSKHRRGITRRRR